MPSPSIEEGVTFFKKWVCDADGKSEIFFLGRIFFFANRGPTRVPGVTRKRGAGGK